MKNNASSDYKSIVLFVCFVFLYGCSQPLRVLMEVDSEQKSQASQVAHQRSLFAALLKDLKRERLKTGTRKSTIVSRYGDPVLEENNSLLYRDPVDFFNSEKVYLSFNDKDELNQIKIEEKDGK